MSLEGIQWFVDETRGKTPKFVGLFGGEMYQINRNSRTRKVQKYEPLQENLLQGKIWKFSKPQFEMKKVKIFKLVTWSLLFKNWEKNVKFLLFFLLFVVIKNHKIPSKDDKVMAIVSTYKFKFLEKFPRGNYCFDFTGLQMNHFKNYDRNFQNFKVFFLAFWFFFIFYANSITSQQVFIQLER